jgi:hypothetical protein
LELELNSYRTNMIRDSIRVCVKFYFNPNRLETMNWEIFISKEVTSQTHSNVT